MFIVYLFVIPAFIGGYGLPTDAQVTIAMRFEDHATCLKWVKENERSLPANGLSLSKPYCQPIEK